MKFEYIDLEKLKTEKKPFKHIDLTKLADLHIHCNNEGFKSGDIQISFKQLIILYELVSNNDKIYYYGWPSRNVYHANDLLDQLQIAGGELYLFSAEKLEQIIFKDTFINGANDE